MNFRLRNTGKLITWQELGLMYPDKSLGLNLSAGEYDEYGIDDVHSVPKPEVTAFQTVQLDGVEQNVDGSWQQKWKVTDITDPQLIQNIKDNQLAQDSAERIAVVQALMDGEARKKGYDNIINASLRAGYPGPFHDEGVKFASWMDACWAKCYQLMDDYKAGRISKPSVAEVVAMMPELELA
jgi:hypothetical protein